VAIILHDQQVKPVTHGWANAAQKLPFAADWRMLFAEYPIVEEKFIVSDKFVDSCRNKELKEEACLIG
jgi:hypothetical protein